MLQMLAQVMHLAAWLRCSALHMQRVEAGAGHCVEVCKSRNASKARGAGTLTCPAGSAAWVMVPITAPTPSPRSMLCGASASAHLPGDAEPPEGIASAWQIKLHVLDLKA